MKITYLTGFFGIVLLVSAMLYLTTWSWIPFVYAGAAIGLAAVLLCSPYKGDNFRLKRLNIQRAIAALMFPVSAWLMYKRLNEWFVCLLVASLLWLYVVFISDYEEKKSKNGSDQQSAK